MADNSPEIKSEEPNVETPLNQALDLILLHLNSCKNSPNILPGNKIEQEKLYTILEIIRSVQKNTIELSEGRLHSKIDIRGVIGGALKNLQSNLKHLTWKTQMIAKGDYSQRVDFLHEFSEAFNSMVKDLDDTKKALLEQTVELLHVNESLYLNREQYKKLIRDSPVSICIINNGIISFTNPQFCQMVHAKEYIDLVGKKFSDFIKYDLFSQNLLDEYFDTKNIEPIFIEIGLVCQDGLEIITEITGKKIEFENKPSFIFFINDITEKKKNEIKILSSLEEKEILIKEVYHRVKNNLQIIVSLLSLQAAMVKDKTAKGYFFESQNRVRSLALIHENLYKTESLKSVNYGEYIHNISSHLFHTYNLNPERVKIEIISENEMISLKQAVPCSLIINEFISNSLKYAFIDNPGEGVA